MAFLSPQKFQRTAFGEQESAPSIPYIEGSATYGLIPANFREFTANNGTTGTENRLFKTSTGTTSLGYGAIQSFRAIPQSNGTRTRKEHSPTSVTA